MDKARVGAMALLLAALPAKAESQSEWWDWTLQEPSVRVEVGDRSVGVRGPGQVRYVEPVRAAVPRREAARYRDDERYRNRDRNDGRYDNRYGRAGVRWERDYGVAVFFGRSWYRTRARYVDERTLRDLLGRGTWARLEWTRRRLDARYKLTGRWLRPRPGVLVLQIRSGPLAIAELTDLNGDGRVDVFLVAER